MENEPQVRNISEIGQRLHIAETAIGLGRRTVRELLKQELVDVEAVEATRQSILQARLQRNQLRGELERARPAPPPQDTWLH